MTNGDQNAGSRSMFLTSEDEPEEFRRLTGKTQNVAHVRALRAMGIEHKVRPDGVVVVLRAHVEALLGGSTESKPSEPEFTIR